MKRLSIVIPMWNASGYIARCIESCLAQNIGEDELEIIVANDGSTDDCADVVRQMQSAHPCIRLYEQENAGAGKARNLGLSHVAGQYVMFVDSDDWLVPNSLASVLELSEANRLDICKYVMECIILNTGEHEVKHSPIETEILFTGDELLGNPVVPLDSACSSLYRREFLDEHGLCFSGQTSSEDVAFNLRVYPHARRVMYTNVHCYTYEIREGSRRHSTDLKAMKRYMLNNVRNAAAVKRTAQECDLLSDATRISLRRRANSMMVGEMMNQLGNRRTMTREAVDEMLSLAREQGIYPISGWTMSWKTTLMSWALNCQCLYKMFFN